METRRVWRADDAEENPDDRADLQLSQDGDPPAGVCPLCAGDLRGRGAEVPLHGPLPPQAAPGAGPH